MWESERIPESWKQRIIIKIPKVLALIILSRIEPKIEKTIREEQAGFRKQRECIDYSNTLRLFVEQSIEWKSPLYITFVDFERSFDTVRREAIRKALTSRGIPQKISKLIQALYKDAEVRVLHNGKLSELLRIEAGVVQGCPLSPYST
ncbi:uncharacterized protein LOC129618986 [Condylostylus longicornis]|uniref:uncharacterized protein LOC129618986 n=1 Tax=Condylostylus longicornis TaxID=2530218 RepID=UPI00244E5518|nr:uncharacterized protein LOC129618986 [Condylostylus longicornis]